MENSVLNKIFKIVFWIYWTAGAICQKIILMLLQAGFQPTSSCKIFSVLNEIGFAIEKSPAVLETQLLLCAV